MSALRVVSVSEGERARRGEARSRILWVGAAGLVALAVTVQPFADGGAWQQLALGRLISSHGLPAAEPFSFLPSSHPWVGGGWLLAVLLAGLTGAGGLGLASLATGTAATGGLVLAALAVRPSARVPGPWLAAAVVVAAVVARSWLASPGAAISVLGVGAVLNIVARWRDGETARLWLLPPLFLLWANCDGGFVAGLAILLVTLLTVGRRGVPGRQALLTAAVLSAALTLANPSGPALYQALAAQTTASGQLSTAFGSPDFHTTSPRLFEAFGAALVVFWAASAGADRLDLTLGLGALGLALWSQQLVPLAAVVGAPQLARYGFQTWERHIAPRLPQLARLRPRLRLLAAGSAVAVVTAAAVAIVAHQAGPSAAAAAEAESTPRAAADYVATAYPEQRLYSSAAWGGYLTYRFPGDRVVFIYEGGAFTQQAVQDYTTVHLIATGWETVLRQNRIAHALVSSSSQEAGALHELGWAAECYDEASGALVMSAPAPGTPAVPSTALTVPPRNVRNC